MSNTSQVITENSNDHTDLCWNKIDREVKQMTEMVVSNDFTGKFKKTVFGVYFNDAFYDQSQGTSRFEAITYVYGFTMLIAFKWTDINFDDVNNPMAVYAHQYKEIADLEELTFIFECAFKDADLTQVKSTEDIYIEIARSTTTGDHAISVADVQNIEKLNRRLWNSPDYCQTVRERVLYFIFEDDHIVKKHGMSLETIVKDYQGTQQFINDFLLVEAMNKI